MAIFQSICLASLLCLQFSCSRLEVSSTAGRTPIYVGPQKGHSTPVQVIIQKDFYLWGFIPGHHSVDLEEEFRKLGAVGVARVSFEHQQTWSQWLFGVISFGLYWPVELKIHGMAKMGDETGWSESKGRWR